VKVEERKKAFKRKVEENILNTRIYEVNKINPTNKILKFTFRNFTSSNSTS